jgi:hypothetical protein
MNLFLEQAGKEGPNGIFRSRRSDWPYRGYVLDWEVAAAIEIKDDLPFILFCSDHPDSELKKEVLTVAHNFYTVLK